MDVEFTDEFGNWWDHLTAEEQASVRAYVKLLEEYGVALKHPYCSGVKRQSTIICGSCEFNIPGDRIVFCTHLIRVELRSC